MPFTDVCVSHKKQWHKNCYKEFRIVILCSTSLGTLFDFVVLYCYLKNLFWLIVKPKLSHSLCCSYKFFTTASISVCVAEWTFSISFGFNIFLYWSWQGLYFYSVVVSLKMLTLCLFIFSEYADPYFL